MTQADLPQPPAGQADIAIIGASVRLPQADSLDAFWQHLVAGRSLITEVPAQRWDAQALRGNPAKGNKTNSIWGGFLADADCFDAEFFNISPREAAWMDPQQRFALELAWKAIEDGGYCPSALAGSRTGVYMGVCHWDYAELIEKNLSHVDAYTPTGIAFSIIANRISHFFDLRGPSIANDTACAASSMSIYEAVHALQSGQCDLALAGGVNLIWSPNHFIAFSKSGMLSKDGASKAFDQRADGYVRGEGGAMLMLKRADQARADGDPIYAIIRGIGSNHGGRTNSLTVTNPMAQAALIAEVYRKAGVRPESVSYIESHGPGTPLGDPIEMAGLKNAFATLHQENGTQPVAGSCSVGSVKTNVGHLEGAAGVTGVIKVLAALRHGALPGNVDFTELNSLIDLKQTPFRIQHELSAWPHQPGQLRRAGVSAFGFGGSNVHILLEESPENDTSVLRGGVDSVATGPVLVPLSARNTERLQAYATELLTFAQTQSELTPLRDLAYTMQVAREQMDCRVLFVVEHYSDLCVALEAFIAGTVDPRVWLAGQVPATGIDSGELCADWLDGKYADWNVLYPNQHPRRIHAVSYPFARERHWMDMSQGVRDQQLELHPLLQRNISRLDEQCYRSRFTGEEYFWQGHHIGTTRVLPGVVYLELARAALENAEGVSSDTALRFENVVWTRPLRAGARPVQVDIRLHRRDQQSIAFEISEYVAASPGTANVQGSMSPVLEDQLLTAVDIEGLRAGATVTVKPAVIYERLRDSGVHHGAVFQVITQLYRGEGYALANLKLSRSLHGTLDIYRLHPILLDAAIQAWVGLDDALPAAPVVPFACREIEYRAPCESVMWALVRPTAEVIQDPRLKRFDIDLCDKSGRVCVRFKELALRVMGEVVPMETLNYSQDQWLERPVTRRADADRSRLTTVLLAGFSPELVGEVARLSSQNVVLLDDASGMSIETAVRFWFGALIERLIEVMRAKPKLNQYFLVLANSTLPSFLTAPLAALLKTVAIENPKFEGALITLNGSSDVDRLLGIIEAEHQRDDTFVELRYDQNDVRSACVQVLWTPESKQTKPIVHSKGTYWITGGVGALGLLFARSLIDSGASCLVLSGRAQTFSQEVQAQLQLLRTQGVTVHYVSCDIARADEVRAVVQWIEREVGALKGVVHAAGVLRDGYILNKQHAEIDAVFASKVAGLVNIDLATCGVDLDFLLCCSSIAAVFGNVAQADYAAANAFMTRFMENRAELVALGQRRGASLSIAWPLWQEGGMHVDGPSLTALNRRFGTVPMPSYDGLLAFKHILQSGNVKPVTVYYGVRKRIESLLQQYSSVPLQTAPLQTAPLQTATTQTAPVKSIAAQAAGVESTARLSVQIVELMPATVEFLKEMLADLIQMDVSRIRSNRKLEEYGLDSIIIVEMTNRLEESLGTLSKTLFFEYVDLDGVAGYLIEAHGEALGQVLRQGEAAASSAPVAPASTAPSLPDSTYADTTYADPTFSESAHVIAKDSGSENSSTLPVQSSTHDIAIVGLSLRVAKADNQQAFWDMLSQGHHGFEKYPQQRWNHEALLHPERDVLGKTVVQTGAFLDGIDEFDPRYFRISQAEAELMSPEVRLFLQSAVEAFEDAGYSRETMQSRYAGDVAVIVGSMTNEYDLFGFQNMLMRGALASGSYTGTVPNMVSYFYGFTGPSYFLDTMCSASATCVHEAVHMLRAGRCKMALAGGVSLLLHPQKLIATSQEHFTTKTAEVIRGYGVGADGTILGEGVGALVLKTLADAQREGDHIYAVIKGTGISNAGVRNGFTVPNPQQQSRAIEQALTDGAIDPRTIGYIEGHGSGTALGDPIEIKALTQAYAKYTSELQFCPIGTVKSNIAHLLAASGLAGIAKVLMQIKHQQLVPSLHAETLNPNIPFTQTPFYVQRELAHWPRLLDADGHELPRRAGVTSIGAGGMNSHIILEEYIPPVESEPPTQGRELLVFSAMTLASLQTSLVRLHSQLLKEPNMTLADVAYTLQVGKNGLPCRLAFVCENRSDLLAALQQYASKMPEQEAGSYYTPTILESDLIVDPAQVEQALLARDLNTLARYWASGIEIDWYQLCGDRRLKRLSLPAYPFERVRCWYEQYPDAPSVTHPLGAKLKLHPFIGINCSNLSGMCYTTEIYLNELLDYVLRRGREQTVLPTVMPELFAAVARIAGLNGPIALHGVTMMQVPHWDKISQLEFNVQPQAEDVLHIVLKACDQVGVKSVLAEGHARSDTFTRHRIDLAPLRASAEVIERATWYARLADSGLHFGPYLEVVQRAHLHADGTVLCELLSIFPQQDHFKRGMQLPAHWLGAAYQGLVLSLPQGALLALDQVQTIRILGGDATHVLVMRGANPEQRDVYFLDSQGNMLATLEGVSMQPTDQIGRPQSREQKIPLETLSSEAPRNSTSVSLPSLVQIASEQLDLELQELVAGLLKFPVSEVKLRAPFYDLGFDSISLVRLANELNSVYGCTLSPAIFFECEHIAALSKHLSLKCGVTARTTTAESKSEPTGQTIQTQTMQPSEPLTNQQPLSNQQPVKYSLTHQARHEPIAIIGISARLPGAQTPQDFFDHLLASHDLVGDLPLERYGAAYRERLASADFPKYGGFLNDIDRFDAAYFNISPHEAQRMDPQQRLMLETVWHALADAGYTAEQLPSDTGVFVGVSSHDYATLLQQHGVETDGFVATGNSLAMVANRVSYRLNVHGPSEAVDTACSSSLVALLRAAEAIRAGRCSSAIVGGVNLALSVEGFEGPHRAGMLSPTGRCQSFSSRADGYVRGEGVIALVIKPLADAERDGDRIAGIFLGGAENHGGRAGSLTAPNTLAQADLIEQAMSGIDPASIGYIETHGTGTMLGDPVEVNGLQQAYRHLMRQDQFSAPFIGLGSVKSNIGHLEAAAGLAGVVKVLLAMQAGELPATLHCEETSPHITLQGSPFYLVRNRQLWPRRLGQDGNETARRGAVSSFGFGGSNAHVVLEEYFGVQPARRAPLPARMFANTRFWLPIDQVSDSTVMLAPQWTASALTDEVCTAMSTHLVFPCEMNVLPATGMTWRVVDVRAANGDIAQRYISLASQLLETLQQLLREPESGSMLIQLLVPLEHEKVLYEGLGAMLDTACAECPRLLAQVISVAPTVSPIQLNALLAAEAKYPADRRVRYVNGQRTVLLWKELSNTSSLSDVNPWRDHGVYVISGGMGALGRLLARHIASTVKECTLVLLGASGLDDARRHFLGSLIDTGANCIYQRVDMCDPLAVAAMVQDCLKKYGKIDGVIHCAGIHQDAAIVRKTQQQLAAVLAPKVAGAYALDYACRNLDLDLFVMFSSLGGAVGNPGQADYAAANGFLDALAAYRGLSMRSIAWPLWRDGGMRVSADIEQGFFDQMGQRPLSAVAGLTALHTVLGAQAPHVAVIGGDAERIRTFFAELPRQKIKELPLQPDQAMGSVDVTVLAEQVGQRLRALLASLTGMRPDDIAINEALEVYGIDSLLITSLNRELATTFGQLSKTLFFEHRTLAQVASHLVRQDEQACAKWVGYVAPQGLTQQSIQSSPHRPTSHASLLQIKSHVREPIAIVGMSGQYPGAADLNSFWENLTKGVDTISEIPSERWNLQGFYNPDVQAAVEHGQSYSKWGGFLEGFADFDPLFFRISPRDAQAMDPQERLFLMSAWAACEDGGYTRARFAQQHGSRVGVFAGITKIGFSLHEPFSTEAGATVRPSTSFGSVANRVSHVLDLNGPSMPVDTMCSSSLTAIHQACLHLYAGECEMAIAGGVNLYLHASNYIDLSASRMLSADGHCKSFGAGGNGFVPGEGVGCLLLKPLSRALADGDRIHALIRSSAVNHGGKTNGYTVPNPNAQREVIRAALDQAGIDAREVSYVEAHGTGTELGDPIEITGLTQAYQAHTDERGFCALGSVKSCIGHLEAAAGIAGVTKVILQMKHRTLTPSLHADELNPNIAFNDTPFVLQRARAPWMPRRADVNGIQQLQARIAGVSSFGAGGANAHVILEEWPTPNFPGPNDVALSPGMRSLPLPIVLSARDSVRLHDIARNLLTALEAAQGEPKQEGDRQAIMSEISSKTIGQLSDVQAVVRDVLANLLSVDQADIDIDEPFESYGVSLVQLHAMRQILEVRFAIDLNTAAFRGADSLHALVELLEHAMPRNKPYASELSLEDIAYTLQRREAMAVRVAFEASSLTELRLRLKSFLDGVQAPGIHTGTLQQPFATLNNDGVFADAVSRLMENGRVGKVLGLWVQGLDINWSSLLHPLRARIISLPTYPFARERFWIPPASPAIAVARVLGLPGEVPQRESMLTQSVELERELRCLTASLVKEIPIHQIAPDYVRWRESVDALLGTTGDALKVLPLDAAWARWEAYSQSAQTQGGPLAQIALAEATLRVLPAILTGTLQATSAMFPEASMELVEAVYKQDRVAQRFNNALAAAVLVYVQRRLAENPGARLRILEIGAGTGATTRVLSEVLTPFSHAIDEYLYTDISRAFLIRAERNLRAQMPYLNTALFNVEHPLESQSIDVGGYDLVIAANVLHATRDMHATMAVVRATLREDALLLINEINSSTLFTHVTFGLLDGWWRFEDAHLRIPGTPALDTKSWRSILESSGFEWVAASPQTEQVLGQQLIAATIRQSLVSLGTQLGIMASRVNRPATHSSSSDAKHLVHPALNVPEVLTSNQDDAIHSGIVKSNGLRVSLLNALGETLNIAPSAIDINLSFADYGLDSILGIELVHKLRQKLGVELEITRLFDFSNVVQFEAFITNEYADALILRNPDTVLPEVQTTTHSKIVDSVPPSEPKAPAASQALHKASGSMRRDGAPIAIVGMSGRFAGSDDVEQLWEHLRAGHDLVGPVSRFDLTPFYQNAQPGSYCDRGSFIDGIDRFDPVFFSISGLEATYMDPQQRLFLEEAWKTLESAGHAGIDMVGRRCGVFVGCSAGDYQELFSTQPPGQAFWGNTSSLIPARIAYFLDLKGPAIAVDTACSSSLVAVHLACQSIWSGESEMALAGGAFVQCSPRFYRYANQAQMLSASGRCAAFGEQADGIVPGEAVAAVLLRPLADALADGDTILGVIAGTGTNQDGTTNGITAPSGVSQEELMRQVYDDFGIDPSAIGMFEAHGTGTAIGDPIEFTALARVFSAYSNRRDYCALGSVKANIGHATTAAGITGLIKVLLALKHEQIPPAIHVGAGNAAIRAKESAFFLNTHPIEWPAGQQGPRFAAVSSFGFSGTNAHLVVQEVPACLTGHNEHPAYLIVLSARSPEQLRQQVQNLLGYLSINRETRCGDIAFTLLAGRRHLSHRLAVVVASINQLEMLLSQWLQSGSAVGVEVALCSGDHVAQTSQTEAAQAMVASARNNSISDNDAYLACIRSLAELFLVGSPVRLDWMFDPGMHRRLALPTYPFKSSRYWVEESIKPAEVSVPLTEVLPGNGKGPATVSIAPRDMKSDSKLTTRHRLIETASVSMLSSSATQRAATQVVLAPTAPQRKIPDISLIHRAPDQDGVRHLITDVSWSPEFQQALTHELKLAQEDENIRVVLMTANSPWSASEHDGVLEDFSIQAPCLCTLPIVASVKGGAANAGLLLLLQCDFVILDTQGAYSCHSALIASQSLSFEHRLGTKNARRILSDGNVLTGLACQENGAGMMAFKADLVHARARDLALKIAAAPRVALVELKRHMRMHSIVQRRPVPPFLSSPDILALSATVAQTIALQSEVIALELFDDGVALIRMCERENKNTFTEAFMSGLLEAFDRIARTPEIKVVVLTGYGPYFACGGTREGLESLQRGATKFTDLKIYSLPIDCAIPVIAAMQGHAIGAGWSLGMFCDEMVLSADSIYHSNYMWFGFTPGAGATWVFPERLGDELGREVLFTATEYKGQELANRGVGLTAVASAQVLPQALARAHQLASLSREQLVREKAQHTKGTAPRLEAIFAQELAMHQKTFVGNSRVMERIHQLFGQTQTSTVPNVLTADQTSQAKRRVLPDRAEIRLKLTSALAVELMIDTNEIRDTSGFLELGLDSILAVTWIRKINNIFDLKLPATSVYAFPTVRDLIDRVAELLSAAPPRVLTEAIAQAQQFSTHSDLPVQKYVVIPDQNDRVRRELGTTLAVELMIDVNDVRDNASFLELGLDSILAVTWIRKINGLFDIKLPATAVYTYPTVGALTAHISSLVKDVPSPKINDVPPPKQAIAPVIAPETYVTPTTSGERHFTDAIAIIGASGRFPKASNLEEFWNNIRLGRDCIEEVPLERWDIAEHYDPDPAQPGKSYSKWMGSIEHIDQFDAAFFNINPREAELMDPQQRLFLQHAWHAIEDAALLPGSLADSQCSVFVGSGPSGYSDLIEARNAYSLIGSAGSILAARIAYLLDLHGPCISLDTACSSSLVAIAQACNSLVLGESDLALAGGACVLIGPTMHVDTSKVGMLSAQGRCFTFDSRANGFVPGEGVGVLLLKRLADAERDGDPIRAVIRGWGVNQDGKTNGITAPNPKAQSRLMRNVYDRFDIDPATIGLIEAHGTGTAMGDPIEIEGLSDAFHNVRHASPGCALGSVKSNVGHLLASAGVAGALKAMLALEHQTLPPCVNFVEQNEHIDLSDTPFYVNREVKDWPASPNTPRRAAVSAFGFSGTNAHLVLEAYRSPHRADASSATVASIPNVCVISAQSYEQTLDYAAALLRWVESHQDINIADLAYTLQTARQEFLVRLAFVFSDRSELLNKLADVVQHKRGEGIFLTKTGNQATALFGDDEDARLLLDKWLAAGRLEKLAELWVSGVSIDWIKLDGAKQRRRIALPGYSFARVRHWVSSLTPKNTVLHPLIDRNSSTIEHNRYSKRLSGTEPWLDHHLSGGERLVLGLFYPEMARAAAELATGRQVVGLKNLVWGSPVAINGRARELSVVFESDDDGLLYYVCADGQEATACHVGELMLDRNEGYWPEVLDGVRNQSLIDRTQEFKVFTGPSTRAGFVVNEVTMHQSQLQARLSHNTGTGGQNLPLPFDSIMRLIAFRDKMCGNAGDAYVRYEQNNLVSRQFPFELKSVQQDGPLPSDLIVRIWSRHSEESVSVALYDLNGIPRLVLDGLATKPFGELSEIRLEEERL